MEATREPGGTPHGGHVVSIRVNGHTVEVIGPRTTGLGIKEAAITAKVPIQLDFILSEEERDGHTRIIGDSETVEVHRDSTFLAVAPDDNS